MHAQSVVVATRECFFPKSISCRLLLMLLLLVNSSCASSWYIGIDTFDFFFLLLLLSFDHAPWNEHSAVHIMCQLKYGKILIWNWKRANSGKNVFSENTFLANEYYTDLNGRFFLVFYFSCKINRHKFISIHFISLHRCLYTERIVIFICNMPI